MSPRSVFVALLSSSPSLLDPWRELGSTCALRTKAPSHVFANPPPQSFAQPVWPPLHQLIFCTLRFRTSMSVFGKLGFQLVWVIHHLLGAPLSFFFTDIVLLHLF